MRAFLKIGIILFALIGALVTVLLLYSAYYFNSDRMCKYEYTYGLDRVDPQHNLSDSDVATLLQEAEREFEAKSGGRNILRYTDSDADINFRIEYDTSLQNIAKASREHDAYFSGLNKEVEWYVAEIEVLKTRQQNALNDFNRLSKEHAELNLAYGELYNKYINGEISSETYTREFEATERKQQEAIAKGNEVNALKATIEEMVESANLKIEEKNKASDHALLVNDQLKKANMISNVNYQPGLDIMGGYKITVEYFSDTDELRELFTTAFGTVLVDDESRLGENSKRFNASPNLLQRIIGVEAEDDLYLLRVCR